jgi:hypothetical protein
MTENQTIRELKAEYVAYYADVPVQKYAAMAIGRDEDTIIRWRKEDADFAESVLRAKAEFVRKRVIATKAEFALERLEKSVFSQKIETEQSITLPASQAFDPNEPELLKINQQLTDYMMEKTKRATTIVH